VSHSESFVQREMAMQFAALLRGVPPGDDRDGRLRAVIRRALTDDEDHRTR